MSFIDTLLEGLEELFGDEIVEGRETAEISEVDEQRKDEIAKVMGEVFTDDVIENWDNLSMDQKAYYLNEYYARAGETLGINAKGVVVEPMEPGLNGYNSGDGYLHVNSDLLYDSSTLKEMLVTTTHEMRHQLQTEALQRPDDFADIPQETLNQWGYEFTHYIDYDYDFEGYYNQAIEVDARAFGDGVVDRFLENNI